MEKKNIVSIEERIPKLKQQRRKKQNRTLLLYLCLFFILIVVIVYLQSPFSNVKELSVTGNDLLSVDDVIEQSALELNSNIWRVRLKEVATVLEDHPLIKEAHITRKLPQTIEMNITEERIVGLVSEDSGLLPLTENGIIHSIENDSSLGKAPILSDFADETYLNRMVEELAKTSDSMLN